MLTAVAASVFALTGCEEKVPVNPPSQGNPYVAGSPEERIKAVENNSMLTPQEKADRIAIIKQRNGLK